MNKIQGDHCIVSIDEETEEDCMEQVQNTKNFAEQAKKIIEAKGGKCETENVSNSTQKLRIICCIKHVFKLSLEDLQQGKWCVKCPERLQRYRELFAKKGSVILNKEMGQVLDIKCNQGHVNPCNIRRIMKRFKDNCPGCNKIHKQKMKAELLKKEEEFVRE